jgi:aspartyl-tRNA(Asn)/glutamyl-tRNA(Gln) amidotransferase subunit A
MYRLSAYELHEAFLKKEISAQKIAKYFIDRIKHYDPKLNSFLEVLENRILIKAKNLDLKQKNNEPLGKLAGIPIAIKDNMHIEGEITTCGSQFLSNYKALFTASAVKLLEEEDALLIGKTNLDEFAMGSSSENSSYKITANPWDLSYSPGGSSSGSAASVAARLVPLATGSDTGGSIRQPASLCGITGFKPTYGRVSRYGLVAYGSSLDQIGPLATNVKDIAMCMEVIGHPCSKDSTCLPFPKENYLDQLSLSLKDTKIGIPWHFIENIDSEAKENFSNSVKILKDLGAEIIEINLDILKYSLAVYYILSTAEASTNLARFDGIRYGIRSKEATNLEETYDLSRENGFGKEVKSRIMLGTYVLSSGYHEAYYKKAQKVRTLMIDAYDKAYEKCDLIAMPVAPSTTFELGSIQDPLQMYLQDLFTIGANLAGLPAISVPSGFSKTKKPFGLQLIGPQMHDVNVISSAYAYEQANNYSKEIPPLFNKEEK